MSDAERLLAELTRHAGGRARLPIEAVWRTFRDVIRGTTGSADARVELAAALEALRARGAIVLPKSSRRWDATAAPPLPAWIRLVRAPSPAEPAIDHRAIAWPPELAFVAELPRATLLDELLAVRRFLAEGGRDRIFVPVAERSLELFGDEKRLAELLKTRLFDPGRLTLQLLRCHDVPPPLVLEAGPARAIGRPVLVLENLDTWHSFCRWNERAAAHAAVAYGHGSEFLATVRDLPRVCALAGTSVVEYFGDLDPRGLEIPHRARAVLRVEAPELALRPAERWYAALLAHASRAAPAGAALPPTDAALTWLPDPLRGPASAILASGRRLAQEHVGLEHLLRTIDG